MHEISVRGVSKVYNPGLFKKKVQAVSDLSLDVHAGEVFGLIGPNGAGKSTTIRMIMGLIRPDSGDISFRGKRLPDRTFMPEVGYLPENPYLYDHLTLKELLTFCQRVAKMDEKSAQGRAEMLLDKLQLAHAQKRPLRSFSKGMLQRAGVCFSLLHDPSLVILDEPMSGLDPIGRKMVFDLILELKEQGKTVFFCSHILSDVERLCDRVGMLVGGRLFKVYSQSELLPSSGATIHLVVKGLSDDRRASLMPWVERIEQDADVHVLSVLPDRLDNLLPELKGMNAKVVGTRTERISLEQLFMRMVQEVAQ